jgi:integrase/recombinase XerD
MATLNLVLDTRRAKKDGSFPLVFRVRIDKKYKDISSGFSIPEKQYNFKTNTIVKDDLLSNQLEQLRSHYQTRLRRYLVEKVGEEDLDELKNFLINKLPEEITIRELWEQEIKMLKQVNRNGNANVHITSLSVISKEMKVDIPFRKMSYKDLLELERRLLVRGLSVNSIGVYMRSFRTICNKAINLDYVQLQWYPFRKYKIKKQKTTPRVMPLDELKAYFNLNLEPPHPLYQSWNIGKLIFFLRGINIRDLLLLNQNNVKGDRIIYKRAKTGKMYSIQITNEIQELLSLFTPNSTLLGVMTDREINDKHRAIELFQQKRKTINAHLKKIGSLLNSNEPITSYVFRYSYANLAKRLGYSKDLIAEALGHQYGNQVTGIYLELFDQDKLDEMNAKLIKTVMI